MSDEFNRDEAIINARRWRPREHCHSASEWEAAIQRDVKEAEENHSREVARSRAARNRDTLVYSAAYTEAVAKFKKDNPFESTPYTERQIHNMAVDYAEKEARGAVARAAAAEDQRLHTRAVKNEQRGEYALPHGVVDLFDTLLEHQSDLQKNFLSGVQRLGADLVDRAIDRVFTKIAARDNQSVLFYYSGPSGKGRSTAEELAMRIFSEECADYFVWRPGWPVWMDWRAADEIYSLIPPTNLP